MVTKILPFKTLSETYEVHLQTFFGPQCLQPDKAASLPLSSQHSALAALTQGATPGQGQPAKVPQRLRVRREEINLKWFHSHSAKTIHVSANATLYLGTLFNFLQYLWECRSTVVLTRTSRPRICSSNLGKMDFDKEKKPALLPPLVGLYPPISCLQRSCVRACMRRERERVSVTVIVALICNNISNGNLLKCEKYSWHTVSHTGGSHS